MRSPLRRIAFAVLATAAIITWSHEGIAQTPAPFFARGGVQLPDASVITGVGTTAGKVAAGNRACDILGATDCSGASLTAATTAGPTLASLLASLSTSVNSLGTAATKNVGTTLGTVADGSVDPIARGAVQKIANLADLASPATAANTLLSALPACVAGSTTAPVPTGQAFQCQGLVLIAQ